LKPGFSNTLQILRHDGSEVLQFGGNLSALRFSLLVVFVSLRKFSLVLTQFSALAMSVQPRFIAVPMTLYNLITSLTSLTRSSISSLVSPFNRNVFVSSNVWTGTILAAASEEKIPEDLNVIGRAGLNLIVAVRHKEQTKHTKLELRNSSSSASVLVPEGDSVPRTSLQIRILPMNLSQGDKQSAALSTSVGHR